MEIVQFVFVAAAILIEVNLSLFLLDTRDLQNSEIGEKLRNPIGRMHAMFISAICAEHLCIECFAK